jgi:hypothetical protein
MTWPSFVIQYFQVLRFPRGFTAIRGIGDGLSAFSYQLSARENPHWLMADS